MGARRCWPAHLKTRPMVQQPGLAPPAAARSFRVLARLKRMRAPNPQQENFVPSIVDELRPWKCSQRQVLAEVRKAINKLREILAQAQPPEDKFRSYNKQCAKKLLPAAWKLYKLLDAMPPRFMSLENYLDLLVRTTGLAAECEKIIAAPARRADYKKRLAAIFAQSLVTDLSTKKPTAGDRNTSFCMIASLLFEATTGEREPNLEYACKRWLRRARDLGWI